MDPNIILKEIQDGNRESFKSLFYSYYDVLVVYAEKYLYCRESSEDVVQEAFIYIWENANVVDIQTSFEAYLYRMVRNRSLNYLKTIKISVDLEVVENTLNDPVATKYEDFQHEDVIKFNEVILLAETMPERMKAVFDLKYRQNYSYLEISKELEISINTVKTQLKRAKILVLRRIPFYLPIIYLYLF